MSIFLIRCPADEDSCSVNYHIFEKSSTNISSSEKEKKKESHMILLWLEFSSNKKYFAYSRRFEICINMLTFLPLFKIHTYNWYLYTRTYIDMSFCCSFFFLFQYVICRISFRPASEWEKFIQKKKIVLLFRKKEFKNRLYLMCITLKQKQIYNIRNYAGNVSM